MLGALTNITGKVIDGLFLRGTLWLMTLDCSRSVLKPKDFLTCNAQRLEHISWNLLAFSPRVHIDDKDKHEEPQLSWTEMISGAVTFLESFLS